MNDTYRDAALEAAKAGGYEKELLAIHAAQDVAQAKAAWDRVIARRQGKPASAAAKPADKGWAKVVARVNKTNRPTKERTPAGGVRLKSSSKVNAGRW